MVLWVVGVMNAINLVDGLDGLAGGLSLALAGADLCARAICTGLLDWEEACCRCRDHGQALCDSREDFLGEFSLQ